MWACRLTLRTDFSYEGVHCSEKNATCQNLKGLHSCRGGKEHLQVEDIEWKYGLVRARGTARPDGWGYHFLSTNTTILYYWSASLCEIEPLNSTDLDTGYAMHLDRPSWFLCHYLHGFNVVILNTGHHWNRGKIKANRWVMHVRGVCNSNRKLEEIGNAIFFTVYSVVKLLNAQLHQHPQLKAFLRAISPRHFANGDRNSGGSCDNNGSITVEGWRPDILVQH